MRLTLKQAFNSIAKAHALARRFGRRITITREELAEMNEIALLIHEYKGYLDSFTIYSRPEGLVIVFSAGETGEVRQTAVFGFENSVLKSILEPRERVNE